MDEQPVAFGASLDPVSVERAGSIASHASVEQVYLEHGPVLRRVAIRKYRVPPGDAEGLVHDVFINYLVTPRHVRAELRAYLIGAICNACRNYWRSRRTEERVFAEGEEPAAADVMADRDLFDGLERNLAVASALAKLGSRCQEALRRYYLNGEDTAAVAAAMNTTPGNVNYLMHVCRKRARAIFEQITRIR